MKPVEITEGLSSVKIYQVVNRGEWIAFLVAWFEDGNRKRKQFSDKEAAQDFARDTARRLADGNGNLITISRRVLSRYQRLESLLQGKTTLEEVVNDYMARHKLIQLKAAPTAEVVVQYLKGLNDKNGKSTLREAARVFSETFTMPIDEIMPIDIESYMENLPELTLKARANLLIGFRSIMEWARDNGYLPERNPTAAEAAFNSQEDEANRILEPEHLKALLQQTPAPTVPFIVLSAYTGLPQQEVKRLRWEDIDWSKHLLSTKGLSTSYQAHPIKLKESILVILKKYRADGGPILDIPVEQLGLRRLAAASGLGKWKASLLTRSARAYWTALNNPAAGEELGIGVQTAKEWFATFDSLAK